MCDALTCLLDNIYIRFGIKLHKQIVGVPTGTNFAPLVAYSVLFGYERDFRMSLFDQNQLEIIGPFNLTFRYLDDLFAY